MEMALENGNAERDNVPDLPSEDDEASEHYNPVENHGRPEKFVTGSLSQERHEGESEDTKQHTVKLVDKRTFQGNEELAENISYTIGLREHGAASPLLSTDARQLGEGTSPTWIAKQATTSRADPAPQTCVRSRTAPGGGWPTRSTTRSWAS